jgi:hypothetical protein
MPHGSLKIIPGVDTNKTPALNEAAVSYSNLIRFIPDRSGAGLAQKIGGWKRYISQTVSYGVIRALKSWQDLQNEDWLAIGSEGTSGLQVYNATTQAAPIDITPNYLQTDFLPGYVDGIYTYGISTSAGSDNVTIVSDVTVSELDYVYFPTQVSVGNLKLYGAYKVASASAQTYVIDVGATTTIATITAVNAGLDRTVTVTFDSPNTFIIGQSIYVDGVATSSFNGTFTISDILPNGVVYTQTGVATAATSYGGTVVAEVTNGGSPPDFSVTANNALVTVTLANHGYLPGDDFEVPISTTVGGITLSGLYSVNSVTDDYTFTIYTNTTATSTTTGKENGGYICQRFLVGIGTNASSGVNYVYGGDGSTTYGSGIYSSGGTGTSANTGSQITATDWSLDNWGQILIANPVQGSIYYWSPASFASSNATYVPNSPIYNEGVFVAMPQRQLVAYGSCDSTFQDPLLIRWSDVEDFTVWQGRANNLAGSYRIPTGSKIVGGMQAAQQGLIWTDLDLWAMQFVGYPNAYGFNKIGANAGLIGRKAMGQLGGVVYWMSQRQFFRLAGSGPEPLPCPIWDQVFQNLYPGSEDKIRCAPNTQFGEITWYYAAQKIPYIDSDGQFSGGFADGTGEVNAYVKYNILLNQWDYGYQNPNTDNINSRTLVARTAWIDQSVLGPPIGAATTLSVSSSAPGYGVFQHEGDKNGNTYVDGENLNGETIAIKPYFRTGYFVLSEGDQQIFIDQVWPDMKWGLTSTGLDDAKVYITFYATNYPGDTPVQYGPYEMTQDNQYLSIRLRARLMSISLSSHDEGTFWRLGNIRYRFQPDGKY